MTTPEFVYGYGRTKHIRIEPGVDMGLCGAYGGYPNVEPDRPVCKRCAKAAKAV